VLVLVFCTYVSKTSKKTVKKIAILMVNVIINDIHSNHHEAQFCGDSPPPNHKGYPLSRATRETHVEGTLLKRKRGAELKNEEDHRHKQYKLPHLEKG
jgi:hypothetical protein